MVDGATIVYPHVAPRWTSNSNPEPDGVKETLVLAGADAPTSFTFPLRLKGLTPQIDNGQVVFNDANGAPRAVIPPGDMVDAKGAVSKRVSYRLVQGALELTVDAAWLKDPGRAFPVAVDPTVTLPVGSGSADASMTAGRPVPASSRSGRTPTRTSSSATWSTGCRTTRSSAPSCGW